VQNISEATQLTEFFFDNLGTQADINSLEGRAKLGTLAMPHISKLPQGIFRQLFLDHLSQITGANKQTLGELETNTIPDQAPIDDYSPAPPEPWDEPAPAPAPRIKKNSNSTGRSACMRALNLILLKPSIINALENSEELKEIQSPDIELLLKVIELAKASPASSTHELMGRIYATSFGSQLIQLLNQEQITPSEGIEKEFKDIIRHLTRSHHRKKTSHSLLERAREKLLSRRKNAKNDSDSQNHH
jgi:DNA primase